MDKNKETEQRIMAFVCLKAISEVADKGTKPEDLVEQSRVLYAYMEAWLERLKSKVNEPKP